MAATNAVSGIKRWGPAAFSKRSVAYSMRLQEWPLAMMATCGFLYQQGRDQQLGRDTSPGRMVRLGVDGLITTFLALHTQFVLPMITLAKMAFDAGQARDKDQAGRIAVKDAIMAASGYVGARMGHQYSYFLDRKDAQKFIHNISSIHPVVSAGAVSHTGPVARAGAELHQLQSALSRFLKTPALNSILSINKYPEYGAAKSKFLDWYQSIDPAFVARHAKTKWMTQLTDLAADVKSGENVQILRRSGPWLLSIFCFSLAWQIIKDKHATDITQESHKFGSKYLETWMMDVFKHENPDYQGVLGPTYANGPALINA